MKFAGRLLIAGIIIACTSFQNAEFPTESGTDNFPAVLDSNYFSHDTVSFSRFDKKPLAIQERITLLRKAISESGVLKINPLAFLETNFSDSTSLHTYEESYTDSTGKWIKGNGRAEIFIFDFNGDTTDDLVVRYNNGADDNACIYFVVKQNRFSYFGTTGANVTHLEYMQGRIVSIRCRYPACCDYPYDTYNDIRVTNEGFSIELRTCVSKRTQTMSKLTLLGLTHVVHGTNMHPFPLKSTHTRTYYYGTIRVNEHTQLGVYEEKVVDGRNWLRVMTYDSTSRCTHIMGWINKANTDYP